jgi:DNA methyltransferase 1-associated protein 1
VPNYPVSVYFSSPLVAKPLYTVSMGTSSDVRAILDLPQQAIASSSSSQLPQQRKAASTSRKPDGITRELYALIGDNAPFLAEAQATINTTKYRERPKTKPRHAKW